MSQLTEPRAGRILAALKRITAELSGHKANASIEDRSFHELGFDARGMAQLADACRNVFMVKIEGRQLAGELSTLTRLARHIDSRLPPEDEPEPISKSITALDRESAIQSTAPSAPVSGIASDAVPGRGQPQTAAQASSAVAPAVSSAAKSIIARQLVLMSRQLDLLMPAIVPATPELDTRHGSVHQITATAEPAPAPLGADDETVASKFHRRQLPLTDAQREIWVAAQMGDRANCAFNESDSIHIRGALDLEKFRQAVVATLANHEAFRLRFDDVGETQLVDPDLMIPEMAVVPLQPTADATTDQQLQELMAIDASTPFDLENGPLVRVKLYSLANDEHLFTICCHHVIFDGYSLEIVIRELEQRYIALVEGRRPEIPETQPYSEFVDQRMALVDGELATASMDYWLGVYGDELPMPLELPADRPRGAARSQNGGTVHREFDREWSQSVIAVAKSCGVSPHALLLSSFSTLMSRLSVQEDLVIGVPAAGQAFSGIDTVGCCVTALPLRTFPIHERPFAAFARETQHGVLDAFEHQCMGLSELVRVLEIPRDPSRLPLIEVMFNFNRSRADFAMPGCQLTRRELRRSAVHYDSFVNIVETGGRLVLDWYFAVDLFDEETIERWIEHYVHILSGIVSEPDTMIGDLPLMSAEEARNVIAGWGAGPDGKQL